MPGVANVVPLRVTVAGVNGLQSTVASFDAAALRKVVVLTVKSGDLNTGATGLLVTSNRAATASWKVGDTLTIDLPAGSRTMPIVGILAPTRFLGAEVILPPAALRTGGITAADTLLFVTRTPGADTTAVTAGINSVLADLPTVILQDRNAFAAATRASTDQLIAIIYALLGLAVIIAVQGIVNTLALSVMERTREVGVLRAVGMSRRQLRSMIRLESVAISVLRAVLGIGLGLIFGIGLQRALSGQGIMVLSIPIGQLLAFVALAALVGVLAAVFPARRAARMDVLHAITTQ